MLLSRRCSLTKVILVFIFIAVVAYLKFHSAPEPGWLVPVHGKVEVNSLRKSLDRRFYIWTNVWERSFHENPDAEKDIGLATQCSADHISQVVHLIEHWHHPMSVSVLVLGNQLLQTVNYIYTMRVCYPQIVDKVSFNFIFPLSHPPSKKVWDLLFEMAAPSRIDCSATENIPSAVGSSTNYADGVSYPVNLLRNTAINGLEQDIVFVIDIDMVPSSNLAQHALSQGLLQSDPNAVLIVPAFEFDGYGEIPSSRSDLIASVSEGHARPFYEKVCFKCQSCTNYSHWLSTSPLATAPYKVQWRDPCEPFYISYRWDVRYDERFEQYGFNRISQLCDMHMKGKELYVLSNAFVIHNGFKEKSSFHAKKDEENAMNKKRYQDVKQELRDKHKDSGRSC